MSTFFTERNNIKVPLNHLPVSNDSLSNFINSAMKNLCLNSYAWLNMFDYVAYNNSIKVKSIKASIEDMKLVLFVFQIKFNKSRGVKELNRHNIMFSKVIRNHFCFINDCIEKESFYHDGNSNGFIIDILTLIPHLRYVAEKYQMLLLSEELVKFNKGLRENYGYYNQENRYVFEFYCQNMDNDETSYAFLGKELQNAIEQERKEKELKKEKERELREQKEKEIKEQKELELKEKLKKEQEMKEKRENELKEKKERELREKLKKEQELKEKKEKEIRDQKEWELREKLRKEQELKEKAEKELRAQKELALKEKFKKEQELKEKQKQELALKEQLKKEQELKEKQKQEQEYKEKLKKEQELKDKIDKELKAKKKKELKEKLTKEEEDAQKLFDYTLLQLLATKYSDPYGSKYDNIDDYEQYQDEREEVFENLFDDNYDFEYDDEIEYDEESDEYNEYSQAYNDNIYNSDSYIKESKQYESNDPFTKLFLKRKLYHILIKRRERHSSHIGHFYSPYFDWSPTYKIIAIGSNTLGLNQYKADFDFVIYFTNTPLPIHKSFIISTINHQVIKGIEFTYSHVDEYKHHLLHFTMNGKDFHNQKAKVYCLLEKYKISNKILYKQFFPKDSQLFSLHVIFKPIFSMFTGAEVCFLIIAFFQQKYNILSTIQINVDYRKPIKNKEFLDVQWKHKYYYNINKRDYDYATSKDLDYLFYELVKFLCEIYCYTFTIPFKQKKALGFNIDPHYLFSLKPVIRKIKMCNVGDYWLKVRNSLHLLKDITQFESYDEIINHFHI